MVKLIHHDVIIKISPGFGREILRVEGLDGDEQVVDAVRLVVADQQLTEIGILQHGTEGVQTLFQDLFPMRHEQQAAGLAGMLFAEPLVVQRRDDGFASAGGGHHQIAGVPAHGALSFQLVQNFLLVGIRLNIQCVNAAVVGLAVLFGFQGTRKALPLAFVVVLKLAGVPVAFKRGGDLIDGLRQVFPGHFHVPFQPAGNGRVGQVGRADIGCCKAGVPVEYIRLGVEPGALGVVADLDFGVGQLAQFFDSLYIGGTHIGSGDDAQLAVVLGELPQFVHEQAQAAPFDEGHQHVDAVSGYDLLLQLGVHLRLVDGPGKQ